MRRPKALKTGKSMTATRKPPMFKPNKPAPALGGRAPMPSLNAGSFAMNQGRNRGGGKGF